MTDTSHAPPVPTVLIIEDSNVQSKIISKQIKGLTSFETAVAHSMEEAVEMLDARRDAIFIAVIDLNLPDAPDGEAVDLCLRYALPSIVLTATYDDRLRETFLEKKVVDFFFKGTIEDMDPMVRSLERIYRNAFTTALVVDDSLTERHLMKRYLEVQNFTVMEAEDGAAALELLEAHPEIRLMVTDYEMPRLDGLELTVQARHIRRSDSLAIIGVSAMGSGALSALFLKHGANDFLTKPFEAEEFYCRCNNTMTMLDLMRELRDCYAANET
ncbi:MAG: response regulator [Desulfovibrionaceae bacterium]